MTDSIYYQLSRYTQPILIVLGIIGAIINQVLFFYRKPLRVASCSLYFRALSVNDFLVLYIYVLLQWLTDQYGFDPTKQYEWYCKIKSFLNASLYTLSPYLIVLACFDRLCTSSTSARLRRIATVRIASIIIPSVIIFVFITYFHVLILIWYTLVQHSTGSACTIINITYNRVAALLTTIYLGFMPPLLMIIFCSITLVLLRQQRRRIMPINQLRSRQRDNQLLKMLFLYVLFHVLSTIPFNFTLILLVFQWQTNTPTTYLLFRLFVLLFNVNFSMSFYIYTLGTPFYRHELYHLIKDIYQRIYRRFHATQIQPIVLNGKYSNMKRN